MMAVGVVKLSRKRKESINKKAQKFICAFLFCTLMPLAIYRCNVFQIKELSAPVKYDVNIGLSLSSWYEHPETNHDKNS
jgi:hypothetical protein